MAKRAIKVWEIKGKDSRRFGRHFPGTVAEGHHAEIVPGERIRLFGVVKAGTRYVKCPTTGRQVTCEEHLYCRDFRIGDTAEYDSYNISYTGTIRSITEKTVTIVSHEGSSMERVHRARAYSRIAPSGGVPARRADVRTRNRLDLYTFDMRNWDFDAEESARRNSEAMMHL